MLGTGSVTAEPDTSQISFSVSKTAQNLSDAQNQGNSFTNTIVQDLEKIGVNKNDIKTENYNSYSNYRNNQEPNGIMMPFRQMGTTIESYTVTQTITISLHNIAKANSVIDTITKDGAENISGPNVTFSQSKQKDLLNQAQTLAIADAKQKAQNLAHAAGIQLGRVVNIQENNNNPFPIQPLMMKAAGIPAESGAPTQINAGESTITASVTLSYETY